MFSIVKESWRKNYSKKKKMIKDQIRDAKQHEGRRWEGDRRKTLKNKKGKKNNNNSKNIERYEVR